MRNIIQKLQYQSPFFEDLNFQEVNYTNTNKQEIDNNINTNINTNLYNQNNFSEPINKNNNLDENTNIHTEKDILKVEKPKFQ